MSSHTSPYLIEFMTSLEETGDPAKVGLYSGIIESGHSIFQVFSIYRWARLSGM